jgi:hypothetical protein
LGLFAPVARIAAAAAAAAIATALVHPLVAGWPAWAALVGCLPVFAGVYAAGVALGHVLRPGELASLAQDVTRVIARRRPAVAHAGRRCRPSPVDPPGRQQRGADLLSSATLDRDAVMSSTAATRETSPASSRRTHRPGRCFYVTGGQQRLCRDRRVEAVRQGPHRPRRPGLG